MHNEGNNKVKLKG